MPKFHLSLCGTYFIEYICTDTGFIPWSYAFIPMKKDKWLEVQKEKTQEQEKDNFDACLKRAAGSGRSFQN